MHYPWRNSKSSIHQLLAEILLQRTQANQVLPVFIKLSKECPTLTTLKSLSLEEIEIMIRPLGLIWRAQAIHNLIKTIADDYSCLVPDSYTELVSLPGVGPYIAGAYLSLHRGIRVPIIDSNIVRIYGRFFGFEYDGETRRKRWLLDLAEELTPPRTFRDYNYALLDFAKVVCKTRPDCGSCILSGRCAYSSIGKKF